MDPSEAVAKETSEALAKIHAAFEAVKRWNGGPDDTLRETILSAFAAAYILTAPEGTSSQSAKAKQRRERLAKRRIMADVFGLLGVNEIRDLDPVAVARVTALLGGVATTVMQEDYIDARKRRKGNIEAGGLSGGPDLRMVQKGWSDHARTRIVQDPTLGPSALAAEIAGNKKLNPNREATNRNPYGEPRAVGTINNYLSKNRAEWDPKRR